MNVLKRTFVLSVLAGAQWVEIDAANEIVADLYQKYRGIIVVLGNGVDAEERIVDLAQIRSDYVLFANTLTILLQSLDGYGFETLSATPGSDAGYVKYASAHYARYAINYAKAGVEYPKGTPVDLLTDVSLRRDDMDGSARLHDYALHSVNGYVHNSAYVGDVTYVLDAGRSMQLTRMNQIGLLSFLEVGKLNKVPVTPSMMSVMDGFQSMYERMKVIVPAEHIGKPFFLVAGGQIIFPDGFALAQVGERSYTINFEKLDYVDKLLEAQLYIDLGSLGLTHDPMNPGSINVPEACSDVVLQRYMQLSQTFFVFVETDRLFWNRIPLRSSNVPGLFTTYQDPQYPLFMENGRMVDYWKQDERGRWSISVVDSYRRKWMHDRERESRLENIYAQLSFDAGNQFCNGSLMEIGGYRNGSL